MSHSPLTRRHALLATAVLACTAIAPSLAGATSFASKPIKLIVPVPPGGGPDLAARILADKISPQLGQPVIVENRPGAATMIGASAVAKAEADGHTLLLAPNTLAISPHVLPGAANFKVQTELVPVIAPATTPMVLVASAKTGVKDLASALQKMRSQPGMSYGSAGNGSPMHFAGELFKQAAKVDLLHVPYRGVSPSLTAAVGGEVHFLFTALGGAVPYIKSGQLVPLAVPESARSDLLPELPTATEQGVTGVEVGAWYGVFAPKGTPASIVGQLNQTLNAALQLEDVRAKFATAGLSVLGGTPAQLGAFVKTDDERYGRMARELNIRVD